jgi:NAD-dependent SIR2 family protein deacetylase
MSHSNLPHVHTCNRCGSLYNVTRLQVTISNGEPTMCEICGEELIPGTGLRLWSAELIRAGQWYGPSVVGR